MPINQKALRITIKIVPKIEQLLQTKDYDKTKALAKEVYTAFDWYHQGIENLTALDFFHDLADYQTKPFNDLTFHMCLDTIIRVLRIATFDEADTWWHSTFQKTLEDKFADFEPEERVPEMLKLLKRDIQSTT